MMMLTSLSSFSISLFRWSAIGSPPAGEETQPPIVEERAGMDVGIREEGTLGNYGRRGIGGQGRDGLLI